MLRIEEEKLAEQDFALSQAAQIQRWLPWIRLYRAFRMALDYRRIIVAMVAMTLWAYGLSALNAFFHPKPMPGAISQPTVETNLDRRLPWESQVNPELSVPTLSFTNLTSFSQPNQTHIRNDSSGTVSSWFTGNDFHHLVMPLWGEEDRGVFWVWEQFLSAGKPLFFPVNFWHWVEAWANTIWILLICSTLGGVICRMAAVDFTGHGELSIRQATLFSTQRFVSVLGAPFIPLVGIAACWIPNLVVGFAIGFSAITGLFASVIWIFPIIASLIMSLIVAGIATSWCLMIAGVTTEASDAFDGLSRGFSYVFNQLWYFGFLLVLVKIMGTAGYYLISLMLGLGRDLLKTTVGNGNSLALSIVGEPIKMEGFSAHLSAWFFDFWSGMIPAIQTSFLFSYFWTAMTIVYILLRQRDDGTPLTSIGGLPMVPSQTGLPIVGIPAARNREAQRNSESSAPTVVPETKASPVASGDTPSTSVPDPETPQS